MMVCAMSAQTVTVTYHNFHPILIPVMLTLYALFAIPWVLSYGLARWSHRTPFLNLSCRAIPLSPQSMESRRNKPS